MGATPAGLCVVTAPAQHQSLQHPVSNIKTPVFALKVYRHYPNATILFYKVKIRTRAVCDYPHGPWGVLATAGPAQRRGHGEPPGRVSVKGQNKPPRPFGSFTGSIKAP
jgi:hypothetical protein